MAGKFDKRRLIRLLPLLIVVVFLFSCSQKLSMSSQYEIADEKPDGFALSKNVLLVADNQLNYLYGEPVWLRSGFTDKLVKVAIRPVQQDLFGQDILKWTLYYYGSQVPVIHLGDGTNMACKGEFESFVEIMSTAGKPWVMAPGNHDACFFGNMHLNLGEWSAACRGAGGPMTKDEFVRRYLAHLQEQEKDFGSKYQNDLPAKGIWRADSGPDNFLVSIAWTIDMENPWRSYVVQEIDLGLRNSNQPVRAILLDTCQYKNAPTLVPTPLTPNSGINGDIGDEQLEYVENWLKDDPTGKKITILIGHHPFDSLLENARRAVDSMRERYRIPLYISAHTHHGEYIPRGGNKGTEGWLELNVGSIVDWPIEFRTFSIQEMRNHQDKLLFRTALYRIPDSWSKLTPPRAPISDTSWEAMPGDPDYYLSYLGINSPDPRKTQEALMDSLLHTYLRLFEIIPSAVDNQVWPVCCPSNEEVGKEIEKAVTSYSLDEKIRLLRELETYEKNRTTDNPQMHRDYRLWQAVWASKYDKLERRQPIPSDSYIIFPRR